MDRYTKGFVVASLVYFAGAALLGILMGAGVEAAWFHFAHVHLNLLGFMAMMVYGVGYFILPRFNGKNLRYPSLLPVHFYTSNIGLVGMVATSESRPSLLFTLFAVVEGISIALFVFNLVATLLLEEERKPASQQEKERKKPILPGMRVGEVLEKYPGIHEVFVRHGFQSLASEAHRAQVRELPITINMACKKHGVDVGALIRDLNEFIGVSVTLKEKQTEEKRSPTELRRGDPIEAHHILGDILKVYPETEEVLRRYYAEGCFTCPGQTTESVKLCALMH
ncbi:MAG: DUF1858 domain-containing protein, partial [Deltaproteobacteria bacterium]